MKFIIAIPILLLSMMNTANSKTPIETLLESDAMVNEAALTAYSMSRTFPIAIKHCKQFNASLAEELQALFDEYSQFTEEMILLGEKIAQSGTKEMSSKEINRKILDAEEKVEEHFRNPEKRNEQSCLGFKAMLEFDLMFLRRKHNGNE